MFKASYYTFLLFMEIKYLKFIKNNGLFAIKIVSPIFIQLKMYFYSAFVLNLERLYGLCYEFSCII